MSWLCCTNQIGKKIFPYDVYEEFSRKDPENQSNLQVANVKYGAKIDKQKYDGWSRIKYKSRNYNDIVSDLKNKKQHFIDEDFPHEPYSISKKENVQEDIVWQRVGRIVKEAKFSNPTHIQSIQKFKCNNKNMQNALGLISRTHPNKFRSLLSQQLNAEGIYQFRFFKNGIIQNIIIDDYVPTFKGYSLFSGPVSDNEVYPMLLEKAIAKISGSYDEMPKNVQQILQMLYCGAIRKTNLGDLDNKEQFSKTVKETLRHKGMCLIYSKSQQKIRHYGINQNELYHLVNQHTVKLKDKNDHVTLYQFISETKLSAWNGKFSITDNSWNLLQGEDKKKLFQHMKENNSFMIQQNDIPRLFIELLVYRDTQTNNKDWVENFSSRAQPSFAKFKVNEADKIFFRIVTQFYIRQSLIIVRKVGDKFIFVDGSFHHDIDVLQLTVSLQKGEYILCLIQDWVQKKEGEYSLYLSSSTRVNIQSQVEANYFNFLQKMIIQYSQEKNGQERRNKKIPVCKEFGVLKAIGFGYMRVVVDEEHDKLVNISINIKQLENDSWQVLQPYKGIQSIMENKDILILIKLKRKRMQSMLNFPKDAFKLTT